MRERLFNPALMAALFIGTLAACTNAPQNVQTAANEGSNCGSAPVQNSQIKEHYQLSSADRQTKNSPPILEIMFCEVFTA